MIVVLNSAALEIQIPTCSEGKPGLTSQPSDDLDGLGKAGRGGVLDMVRRGRRTGIVLNHPENGASCTYVVHAKVAFLKFLREVDYYRKDLFCKENPRRKINLVSQKVDVKFFSAGASVFL